MSPMIGRVIALAFGLFGGLVASQAPEFAQQYRQRLGGAIDELKGVVSRFDADSAAVGRSRDEMMRRLREDGDAGIRRQGDAVQANADRLAALERQRQAFREAGPFARMVVLLREADPSVARAAYLDFEPAVPTTQEGVISAGTGFVLVWAALLFVARIMRRLFGRRRGAAPRRSALRSA